MTFIWSLVAASVLCGGAAAVEWWLGPLTEIKIVLNSRELILVGWQANLAVLPFVALFIFSAVKVIAS